jgi:two-component system, NtrC family, response regulator PilR
MLEILLRREGYELSVAESGREAIELLEREPFDLIVSDVRMPDVSGVEVIRTARAINPSIITIMMTAFGSRELIDEVERLGVNDYVEKPFNVEVVKFRIRKELDRRRLQRENVLLKRTLKSTHQFSNIVGTSEPMVEIFQLVETIAPTSSTVLITGDSGTGKELIARAIHYNSTRRDRPFVALNCGALSETLLDSELFGHVRGAFTGADTNKKGLIEVAEKGTIFLDEIGEMSPVVQVKLLRVLQERRFRRLGGTDEVSADIRIIAATNRDLAKLVADGRFREDLFYRINVIPIHLPPLRERGDDIALLADHFLVKYGEQMGKSISAISQEALHLLQAYEWPGNIRQLENVIERAVALEKSQAVLPESLPEHIAKRVPKGPAAAGLLPESGFNLEEHVEGLEKEYITQALARAGGVQVKAAELLGIPYRSFRYYAKKYNLT